MFFLHKLIIRFLLLKDFLFAILFFNPDAIIEAPFSANIFLKKLIKKLNQTDLDYFNPHLDKAPNERKIVLVNKNIYYKNIMFFV